MEFDLSGVNGDSYAVEKENLRIQLCNFLKGPWEYVCTCDPNNKYLNGDVQRGGMLIITPQNTIYSGVIYTISGFREWSVDQKSIVKSNIKNRTWNAEGRIIEKSESLEFSYKIKSEKSEGTTMDKFLIHKGEFHLREGKFTQKSKNGSIINGTVILRKMEELNQYEFLPDMQL